MSGSSAGFLAAETASSHRAHRTNMIRLLIAHALALVVATPCLGMEALFQ